MVEPRSQKHYTACGNCGQQALTVATRCPHCGHPFDAQFYQRPATKPGSRPVPIALIAVALVITVVIANAVRQRFLPSARQEAPAGVTPAPRVNPSPTPPADSTRAAPESLATQPAAALEPPEQPAPPAAPAPEPAPPRVPAPEPEEDQGEGLRRYANVWTNVRAGRSGAAPILRILRPGEAVLVDSLQLGWYRLVSPAGPSGYVDYRLLDTLPPAEPR